MYKILDTGTTFKLSEFADHFPNTSIPSVLSAKDLKHLGIIEIPDPAPTVEELSSALTQAKAVKNIQINNAWDDANNSKFIYLDHEIACDKSSRSDIDGVANNIALTGNFPIGFPGVWKTVANSYIPISTIDDFKAMYSAMTCHGVSNYIHAQELKTVLFDSATTTVDQVDKITW